MKNLKFTDVLMVIFLILLGCTSNKDKGEMDAEEYFDIKFEIDPQKNELYTLVFTVELEPGNYFVSPHSLGQHQRLIFSLEDTDSLLLNDELLESPRTFSTYDDLSQKGGRFVRKTTKYFQNLTVNSLNDFEVAGLIWIELLPVCQPYEIEFTISYHLGKLEVSKGITKPSFVPTFWDNKTVDPQETNNGIIY